MLRMIFYQKKQQFRIYRSIVKNSGKETCDSTDGRISAAISCSRDGKGMKAIPSWGSEEYDSPWLTERCSGTQIKAMLRAGYESDLHILLPMVTDVDEIIQAREEIAFCRRQLERRGDPFNTQPKVGAMIELPSAAMGVREIAIETDFLSIGTNDLTMYLLAVDRTNENLSHLYSRLSSFRSEDAGIHIRGGR